MTTPRYYPVPGQPTGEDPSRRVVRLDPDGLDDGEIPIWDAASKSWVPGTPADAGAIETWYLAINPLFGDSHARVGSWAWSHDGTQDCGGYYRNNSPGAQNDYAAWDIVLANGTYSVDLLTVKGPNAGILKPQLDDGAGVFTDLGTFDAYAAGVTYNQRVSFATPAVTGGTKKRRLRFLVDARHALSGGYQAFLTGIQVRRTA